MAHRTSLAPQVSGRKPQERPRSGRSLSDLSHQLSVDIGNQAMLRMIQTKSTLGQPGDEFESDADRVADRVMGMPDPGPRRIQRDGAPPTTRRSECACGGTCAKCQRGNKTKPAVGHATSGAGRPLDTVARNFLEPRFGRSFDDVRIHADPDAAAASDALRANAFTAGRDIYFAEGRYAPETAAGRRLIAHELTHVVQQQGAHAPGIQLQPVNEDVKPSAEWRSGMLARVVRDRIQVRENPPQYNNSSYKLGEILEVREVNHIHQWLALTVPARMKGREYSHYVTPLYIDLRLIEPVDPATVPVEPPQDEVTFQVDVLNDQAFTDLTGIDPDTLPEGQLISVADALGNDSSPGMPGAAPGVAVGWARAPWPAFPVPENATGVQWTQTGFGHFSQFANVPGSPTIGGYRSSIPRHGY